MLPTLAALLALSTGAMATDLDSAEFQNTAHTLKAGQFCLHPLFMPSSAGVTDRIELKTEIVSWYSAANLTGEVGILQSDKTAVSVEAGVSRTWYYPAVIGTLDGRFTQAIGKHRLNVSAGGGYSRATGTSSELGIGFDLVAAPNTTFQFLGDIDPLSARYWGTPTAHVGFAWNHSWDIFRMSIGLNAWSGSGKIVMQKLGVIGDMLTYANYPVPSRMVVPYPTLALWWKF